MLRADNIVCGTSTTGTGTLTLAATPTPPGGIDFDVFARALGFGNNAVLSVRYVMTEFTSSGLTTAKQSETGIGTLTLGASAGIANCTLARTTLLQKGTSMDSQPATLTPNPGTGITIVTAANVLVSIDASAFDMMPIDAFQQANNGAV